MTIPMRAPLDATPDAAPVAPPPPEAREAAPQGQPTMEGALLTEPDERKVARRVEYFWSVDDQRMDRRKARYRRNKYWRAGIRNVYLTTSDEGSVEVYAPPSSAILPPVPNYTDRLCRRVTMQLFADPMQPDIVPVNGDEEQEAHAEFATKLLRTEHNESGVNFRRLGEAASDMAHTFGSSFLYATVDPKGGGWEPMDLWAHPNATTLEEAEAGTDPQPPQLPPDPMAPPPIDPLTGQPMPPQPMPNPRYLGDAVPPVKRYVRQDGTLSEASKGARRRWIPAVRWLLLPSINVRFVPHTTVAGLTRETQGVVLCVPTTLGELKAAFPKVAELSPEALQGLAQYRPPKFADLKKLQELPEPKTTRGDRESEAPSDDTVCYPLTLYFRAHAAYPEGAYVVVCGGKVLHRQAWKAELPDGSEECLDLPLAQCRDFDATAEGDPYGTALAEYLGPLDEIHAQTWSFLLEHMYKHGNPNVFIPATSPVTPEQLRKRDGTPIFLSSPQDIPTFEQPAPLPKEIAEMRTAIAQELNSESGLEQSAQGVASPSVKSGIHAEQIIEQALVALGQLKRNMDDCMVRAWRVHLQLVRAFFSQPQKLAYESEDGAWREQEWTNMDLLSAKTVRIAPGTSTMMTRSAKAGIAQQELQLGAITLAEYQQVMNSGVSTIFGRIDNPHKQRVMRQIVAWKQGPPEGVEDEQQMAMAAAAIFAPLPVDDDPQGAPLRYMELAKLQASTAYPKHPPAWRSAVDNALMAARQAAGIVTVAEQQQQMAMQQQQQMAAQQQQQAAQQQEAEAQRGEQRADGERKHQQSLERDAAKQEAASVQAQQRAEAQMAVAQMRQSPEPPMA